MSESRNFLRFITFFGAIIGVLLIVALLLSSTCHAQTNPVKFDRISGFLGLNTVDGDGDIDSRYARICNNIVLSKFGIRTLSKRPGFDSISVKSGADSIIAIGVVNLANGQRCLVFATDSTSKGYGCLWATQYGSTNLDSARLIATNWSVQKPTTFFQFNDRLYAFNGQQTGIIWDGTYARNIPLQAPGLPQLIPLTTSGNLNGEYRYAIYLITAFKSGVSYSIEAGTLSPPIFVSNGQVLLRNFGRVVRDSLLSSVDSAYCYIARTRSNPGEFSDNDSLFRISTTKIYLKIGADYTADTVTYTDNIADASLGSLLHPTALRSVHGRDSLAVISNRRWSAPTFIRSDTVTGGANQMWAGAAGNHDNLNMGYAYTTAIVDTFTGLESDTGRTLWVRQKRKDSTLGFHRITIGLPRVGANESGLLMNVYRSELTLYARQYFLVCAAEIFTAGGWQCTRYDTIWTNIQPARTLKGQWWPIYGIATDSLSAVNFRRVAQVPTSQDSLVDSIRCDSANLNGRFKLQTSPGLFSGGLTVNNQVLGWYGSRLWRSSQLVDSQANYPLQNYTDFDPNDGHQITGMWLTRNAIRVKKDDRGYNLRLDFRDAELSEGYGMIAPLSHVKVESGDMYMSRAGVVLESEGPNLERTFVSGLVSDKLDNFKKMSVTTLSRAVGAYLPDQRQALWCIGDTTYVYDVAAQAWSTFTNMTFGGACLYDTGNTVGLTPTQTLYFFKKGGSTLYKYANSSGKDVQTGAYCPIAYKTPLLYPDFNYDQILQVNLQARDAVAGVDILFGEITNEKGTALESAIAFDSLATGYCGKYVSSANWGLGLSITLQSLGIGSYNFATGSVQAIEIFHTFRGVGSAR